MIDNSYYSQEVHGPYELHDIGNLELEEGGTIRGVQARLRDFRQAQWRERQRHPHSHLVLRHKQDHGAGLYRSGPRARSRQVFHHHRQSDRQWSFHLAAQHAGAGRDGELSPCPHRRRRGGATSICSRTEFDLKSLALVVGGSMGAQQTYEWAVRYPDMVKRAAPIAGTAKNTIHRFSFHGDAGRCDHLRPRFQQGLLRVVGRRKGRLVAPRKNVGGEGLEHGIFPARAAQSAGLFVDG